MFNKEEIAENIGKLKGWTLEDQKIKKLFKFKDFISAIKFVNIVADIAEEQNHHPDISVTYNKVLLTLWTHDLGGLSEKDFALASKIDFSFSG